MWKKGQRTFRNDETVTSGNRSDIHKGKYRFRLEQLHPTPPQPRLLLSLKPHKIGRQMTQGDKKGE